MIYNEEDSLSQDSLSEVSDTSYYSINEYEKCLIKDIEWINPLDELSETFITRKRLNQLLKVSKVLIKVFGSKEIYVSINVLTVMQLFIYYITRNKVFYYDDQIILLTNCFVLIQSIYSDKWIQSKSQVYQFMSEGLTDILNMKKLYSGKYMISLLTFLEYDPFGYPLTINYLMYSENCLGMEDGELNESNDVKLFNDINIEWIIKDPRYLANIIFKDYIE